MNDVLLQNVRIAQRPKAKDLLEMLTEADNKLSLLSFPFYSQLYPRGPKTLISADITSVTFGRKLMQVWILSTLLQTLVYIKQLDWDTLFEMVSVHSKLNLVRFASGPNTNRPLSVSAKEIHIFLDFMSHYWQRLWWKLVIHCY